MGQSLPIKFRYSFIIVLMFWLSLLIAVYPSWVFAELLAVLFNIPEGAPIKEQENGWLWFTFFMVGFIILVSALYMLWALIIGKLNGWSVQKCFYVFIKGRYPKHWYKVKVT